MKRFLLCALLVLNAGWAQAGPLGDVLVACFSESTTGRDRTDLARWFFLAMGQHPAIKELSNFTPEALDNTNRRVGALYTRLITESCPSQTSMAVQKEGSAALVAAYGALGKLAMQELMTNPQVTGVFSGTEKYVDSAKIRSVMEAKRTP
jgi:hypothetical protein